MIVLLICLILPDSVLQKKKGVRARGPFGRGAKFRKFQKKVISDWDGLDEDEKAKATQLGQQMLTPLLNELLAHFDNHLSANEFRILKWTLEVICNRPHVRRAFEFLKPGYPDKVHNFYDDLCKNGRRHLSNREASQLSLEN